MGVDVSNSTFERCLHRAGLKNCRPGKTPLLKKCPLNVRLKFAKEHVEKPDKFWGKVLWSDETKVELYGHNDLKTVWRKKSEAYHPKNTIPTGKHGEGNLMLWGCLSSSGVGKLVRVHGIMKKEDYKKILEKNVHESACKLSLRRNFVFQQDSDPRFSIFTQLYPKLPLFWRDYNLFFPTVLTGQVHLDQTGMYPCGKYWCQIC